MSFGNVNNVNVLRNALNVRTELNGFAVVAKNRLQAVLDLYGHPVVAEFCDKVSDIRDSVAETLEVALSAELDFLGDVIAIAEPRQVLGEQHGFLGAITKEDVRVIDYIVDRDSDDASSLEVALRIVSGDVFESIDDYIALLWGLKS